MIAILHGVFHVAVIVCALIGLGSLVLTAALGVLIACDRREQRLAAIRRHPAGRTDWDAALAALITANPPEEH